MLQIADGKNWTRDANKDVPSVMLQISDGKSGRILQQTESNNVFKIITHLLGRSSAYETYDAIM